MNILILLLLPVFLFCIALFVPSPAHAIVILPALILIPIIKLVAVVVGSLLVPVSGLGLLIKSVTKNRKMAILVPISIIIIVAVIAFLFFRMKFPDSPIF